VAGGEVAASAVQIIRNYSWERHTHIGSPDFHPDDYGAIDAKYFARLRQEGLVDADPSGWLATVSEAARYLRLPYAPSHAFARYYIDEGSTLKSHKEAFATLLSEWEGRVVGPDEFTLCPSGATASVVTLASLKALGVTCVQFETPCYFASIEQSEQLELPITLLPTYRRDSYRLPTPFARPRRGYPSAVWLTQPRAFLGFNQDRADVAAISRQLGPSGFLVVDEATDQSFPAHLCNLPSDSLSARVIRIRSFTKGMGLNGFRMAAILHPAHLRTVIVGGLESFGGALDAYSLNTICDFAKDIPRLKTMLTAANLQVNRVRRAAERLVMGTPLAVNHLVNGYIGSVVADLTDLGRSQPRRRTRLLEGCCHMRTPVMLGASSYMAKDPPNEGIRLNFFMAPDHITRGIANILSIWNRSKSLKTLTRPA